MNYPTSLPPTPGGLPSCRCLYPPETMHPNHSSYPFPLTLSFTTQRPFKPTDFFAFAYGETSHAELQSQKVDIHTSLPPPPCDYSCCAPEAFSR